MGLQGRGGQAGEVEARGSRVAMLVLAVPSDVMEAGIEYLVDKRADALALQVIKGEVHGACVCLLEADAGVRVKGVGPDL